MPDRLFVAHASIDESLAAALKEFVETVFSGASVFLAEDGIRGGAGWFERIRSELAGEPVILALVTQNSLHSPWLYFEAGAGFVGSRSIPVCGGTVTIDSLLPPFSALNSRQLSNAEQIAKLAWDLSAAWGHARRPEENLLERASARLVATNQEVLDVIPVLYPSSDDEDEDDPWNPEPRDRSDELRYVAQLAVDLDHETRHWDELMRLFSTNGRTLVAFLSDVYDYRPPEDAEWHHKHDDVLKEELARLPTELHRIIVEYHWGVWYNPIPDERVAAALRLTIEEHQQKLTTAVSLLRERKDEALHEFRKRFEFEYREFR